MAEHAIRRHQPHQKEQAAMNATGARIEVLTCDPRRKVVIVPGCHIDSLRDEENAYFFQAGDTLVGMVVEGGTVEYHPADHTYVVRLADGQHAAD
ncbi:hypothetical protein [Gordonia rhizosphera]|uniref:Uncharacterized protein MT0599 domain-containing protein n=1 Tax=Gordonia rhizosphera NBRC 16068 TaxID=1108045 RepID=K6W902_9ACTN|nr:hypothetical protein [Gordonia rhizosphera]GAB88687.1 hypothetical protein GORHZ_036_00110 [Gordonia rhizosphera NBRC 16068]